MTPDEPLTTGARLSRHARRIGADRAAATDPTAHYHQELLRLFLNVVEAALNDEQVDRATALRVIDRVIYGCVPNPVDAAERVRATRAHEAMLREYPTAIELVEAYDQRLRQRNGPQA